MTIKTAKTATKAKTAASMSKATKKKSISARSAPKKTNKTKKAATASTASSEEEKSQELDTKKSKSVRRKQRVELLPWSAEEDAKIVLERSAGRSFKLTAQELGTTALACRNRFNVLVKEGFIVGLPASGKSAGGDEEQQQAE